MVVLGQFPGLLGLVFVPPVGLVQRLGPVPDDADVGAEEVVLGGGGQGEGVPLQPGDGGTLDEDVLTHLHAEALLLHLQLQSVGRVHHHLDTGHRDIRAPRPWTPRRRFCGVQCVEHAPW